MALKEEFVRQGNWLFRWRSYLPVLGTPLFVLAMKESRHSPAGSDFRFHWEMLCMAVSFLGLGIRVLTAGFVPARTSDRNTRRQVADTLNTTGFYSIVRHPLYLGNFFIVLGITLFFEIWWFSLLVALIYWIYYERIMFAEEEFLRGSFGDAYEKWAADTPAFIPDIRKWRSPDLRFSPRTVLRREYTGLFGIVASFTFLDFSYSFTATGRLGLGTGWTILFFSTLAVYLTVMTIKRKTRILHVRER